MKTLTLRLALLPALAFPVPAQELFTFEGGWDYELNAAPSGEDVDGDGVPDLMMTAAGSGFGTWTGGVQVRSGADGSILHELGTSTPNGFGRSAALVGDLNLDGHSEFLVGAWLDDTAGNDAGRAFLYSGVDGALLQTLEGPVPDGVFGYRVAALGLVDGDLIPDYAVGAPNASSTFTHAGIMTVFSGADASVLFTIEGEAASAFVGRTMSPAGDVDGDGHDDFAVGIPSDDTNGTNFGVARIYSGFDGSILHEVFGQSENDGMGGAVGAAGDVNADGLDDFMVSSSGWIGPGEYAGRVQVFSGLDGTILHEFYGYAHLDGAGMALAGVGDLNADGYDDIAFSSERSALLMSLGGYVRVHSGLDGSLMHLWHGYQSGARFGNTLHAAGDTNGDGAPDIFVGAPFHEASLFNDAGRTYVLSGGFVEPASYCFADGVAASCPCGNLDPDAGCANSTGVGARLTGTGSGSLSDLNLICSVVYLPPQTFGLVFLGDQATSLPFADGSLCAGQPVQRFPVLSSGAAGAFGYGRGLPGNITVAPMTTSYLQAWYRDPQGPCGTGSNLSNGIRVDWIP